ncbi:hypothetical protein ABZS99_48365, partial [Streptomyces sp. NPDC005463]|uniref:hypothetical protein n=1 Tax=Streptomyces sp. NPDC005463 TaxID=3154465 RepID=UPI00339F1B81
QPTPKTAPQPRRSPRTPETITPESSRWIRVQLNVGDVISLYAYQDSGSDAASFSDYSAPGHYMAPQLQAELLAP